MRSWFGKGDRPAERIELPLATELFSTHVVYFSAETDGLPEADTLLQAVPDWVSANLQDPLRKDLMTWVRDPRFVSVRVDNVESLPPAPVGLLRYTGLGELEERMIGAASHVAIVNSGDVNRPPRFGLWASLAASLAIASRLGGVIFDPEALRVVKPERAISWFTPNGTIAASQHIIVPFSVGHDRGLGWMTTRGMSKFGFPDLELRDVPPNLDRLSVLMNAVAQLLILKGMRKPVGDQGNANTVSLPREIPIGLDLVALARGDAPPSDTKQPSQVTVALEFNAKGRGEEPPMIEVKRPATERDTGVWLNKVAAVLLNSAGFVLNVETASDRMTKAHRRAVEELPYARKRFTDGLRPGERLYVKRGFDTASGSKEYLWLVVTQWSDRKVTGLVGNDPVDVPNLKMGETVTLDESEVFDWTIQMPGDRSEGGYTSQAAIEDSRNG